MLNFREFSNCLPYKMRSIHFGCSIAIEFDSLDDGKTSRHKGSQCHHVLPYPPLPFFFSFSLMFPFFICNCALSAYCFVKISCESIHIGVWLLFDLVQNSQKFLTETISLFHHRHTREYVLMPDSQVNCCRTATESLPVRYWLYAVPTACYSL